MAQHAGRGDGQHGEVRAEQAEDRQDVRRGDHRVRRLLAPLPRLLPLLVPQSRHHEVPQHQEHLPGLLLAGHGQLRRQPNRK